jgi:hypothetical protein
MNSLFMNSLLTKRSSKITLAWVAVMAAAVLAGCKSTPLPPPATPAPPPAAIPAPAPPPAAASGLPTVRSMADYRRRAAQLIMQANPNGVATGPLQDPLYSVVVVTIALNADGTVRSTNLMRRSTVGPDGNNLAMEAVRRVRSYGPVTNLPQPWEYNETFFYNDARKFQLRTIVEKL